MRIWIIYKITNSINNKIYIGQTCRDFNIRVKQHIYNSKKPLEREKQAILRAIYKYGEDNFIFEELLSVKSIEDANNFEKYFIKLFNSQNKKYGYNLTGGGSSFYNLTEEQKEKKNKNISKAHLGKIRTEESKRKQSESRKNKKISPPWKGGTLSEEWRKNLSEAHKGQISHRKRKVGKFKDGILIKEYESITAAEKDGFYQGAIQKCLKNIYKQHKGFQWKAL